METRLLPGVPRSLCHITAHWKQDVYPTLNPGEPVPTTDPGEPVPTKEPRKNLSIRRNPGCPTSPISCGVSWIPGTSCAFPQRKAHTQSRLGLRTGNSGHLARFSRDVGYHCAKSLTFSTQNPVQRKQDGCPTFASAYVGRKRWRSQRLLFARSTTVAEDWYY
jgi:hypothetical protein